MSSTDIEVVYNFIDEEEDPQIKKKTKKESKTKTEEKKKNGRPSLYSEELANKICQWLSEGKSLTSLCKQDDMPTYATVMNWLWKESDFKKGFLERYETAREQQAECLADELIDIADDGTNDYMEKTRKDGSKFIVVDGENIQRSRLRADTRKWIAAKLRPKKYGDSSQLKLTDGEGTGSAIFKVIYENRPIPKREDGL
jgi:hypothetical protein